MGVEYGGSASASGVRGSETRMCRAERWRAEREGGLLAVVDGDGCVYADTRERKEGA
jgi:hypothetical protein